MDFKIDFDGIAEKVDQAAQDALLATAYSVADDIRNKDVIPRMRGVLEDTTLESLDVSRIAQNEVVIHSNTPYARRLYEHPEYNFHREPWSITHRDGSVETFEGNPNARAYWFEPWEDGGEHSEWVKTVFNKHLMARLKL